MASKNGKKAATSTTASKAPKPKNGKQYSQVEFFSLLQENCELQSKKEARDVYAGVVTMLQGALKKGYKVPMPGIGKLQVRQTKARMGRNPQTGEVIKIKAKKRIRLTPAKALKDAVL